MSFLNDPDSMRADRRRWMRGLGAAAVAALMPAVPARIAFAAAPAAAEAAERPRLVVVLLRGALDGLAAVPPIGDPAFAALRPAASAPPPAIAADPAPTPRPLDALFALHPALATLHGWYGEGQLLVAHAVASPYRERSHFDAQQLLESGGSRPFERDTGWLGRALASAGGQGVALGATLPLGLRGADGATTWAPGRQRPLDSDLVERLSTLYGPDAALGPAFAQARLQREGLTMGGPAGSGSLVDLARQGGRFLAEPGGPSVAWIDSTGWDTHTQQAGRLARGLAQLDLALGSLRESLGAAWSHTTVLVLTEFGRSAALNGSGGTDHGTAAAAFVAGGAVAGGRVLADWPGVAPGDLLDGRDLRATMDIRSLIRPVLQRQFRLSDAVLDSQVLPGMARAAPIALFRP
jgi:uncharacterized protein (DUF1501 family)